MSHGTRTITISIILVTLTCGLAHSLSPAAVVTTTTTNSSTKDIATSPLGYKCKNGLFVPQWLPTDNLSTADRGCRATVYFLSLAFLFLGVSIIAERFMSSIEIITSKEKVVTVRKSSGETVTLNVRIWNETVSNLTLMALGSSAPEIMLTAIEVGGNDFRAGDLGPGTIVGSAAFNLFVIISICIFVIPRDEVRRVKHVSVFLVTATWSLLAYLWLYLIIDTISPGVIHIWEGVVTLALFPITVFTAYVADRRFLSKNVSRMYRASRNRGVVIETEGATDLEMAALHPHSAVLIADGQDLTDELLAFEQHRKEYITALLELRQKNPSIDMKALEEMAEQEVITHGPKSRAFHRVQAVRRLTGGGDLIKRKLEQERIQEQQDEAANGTVTKIHFEPAHYTVMESVGSLMVTVKREGGNQHNYLRVNFCTHDGTALAGSDYRPQQGTVVFPPDVTEIAFKLDIIDDDIFEEDKHFFIKLSSPATSVDSVDWDPIADSQAEVVLGTPAVATIMILDDDHSGIFHFESEQHDTYESIGECHVKVIRSCGARGRVTVPYSVRDGTAKAGLDYTAVKGELVFDNDEFEKYITVPIVDRETYEKNDSFNIQLHDPVQVVKSSGCEASDSLLANPDPVDMTEEERIAELGKPRLGELSSISIHILESPDFKETVDKMLHKTKGGFLMGTSSWREQFVDAVTVSSVCGFADDDACETDYGELGHEEQSQSSGTDSTPSCGDYVMHFLSLFWKLLFATVPPTEYMSGWLCFVVSILWIAILTGIIGDLASALGCTIKLKDSVTAISFVALGTSVPDTFASKVAAIGDKYADSSIGNVTGSNGVNVFLGIGLAWTMAAVVNYFRGEEFKMDAGSLAFSLTLYFIFAVTAIILILVRRIKAIGGELGGPLKYKIPSSLYLAGLWVAYVVISSLEAYGYIQGF